MALIETDDVFGITGCGHVSLRAFLGDRIVTLTRRRSDRL
jgi:hypothetical protein